MSQITPGHSTVARTRPAIRNGCLAAIAGGLLLASASPNAGARTEVRHVTPQDLVQLRDIGGHHQGRISVSPDGTRIAYQLQTPDLQGNTYRLMWYVVSTTGNHPSTELADGGELLLNPEKMYITNGNRPPASAVWAADSSRFFHLKRLDGRVHVWEQPLDGSQPHQITSGDRDVMDLRLSVDGTRLLYSVSEPIEATRQALQQEGERGYLFDDRFRPFSERWPTRHWCGEGWTDTVSIERACRPPIRVYGLASGTEREALPAERDEFDTLARTPTDRASMARAAGSEKRGAWFQDMGKGLVSGSRLQASIAGRTRECRHDACASLSFSGPWWSAGAEEVFFIRRNVGAGTRELMAWNPEQDVVRSVWAGDDVMDDCQVRASRLYCLHETRDTPRKIVALSLADGTRETVLDPNPSFAGMSLTRHRKLTWTDQYANDVFGWLTLPAGYTPGRRYPLVVLPYNASGFLRGDTGDEYPGHVFAAEGMMVLSMSIPVDMLKEIEHRDEVSDFDHLRGRISAFSALERILDQLDREGLIDPARIGMTGLSNGAMQVHYALINSHRITAASVSGVVTPESWYDMESTQVRRHMRDWWGGAPSAQLPNYRLNSYHLNVDRIDAALLANVSDEEFLVSNQEFSALKDAGKAVEMHVFPGEHHIKWMPRHRLNIYRRNVQWFKFWLMGIEDSTPVDPDQYQRWRALRDARSQVKHGPGESRSRG
ncbi:Atxe2 family lasso peptide isopeptidase [Luteimonas sp. RIT-PG2_3]